MKILLRKCRPECVWVVLVVWVLLAAGARADTILLDNGRSIKGKIVKREGGSVVILLDSGGRMTIPASRVVMVTPEPPPPPPPVVKAPPPTEKPDEAAEPAEAAKTPEETAKKPQLATAPVPAPAPEKKSDPALEARIARLIPDLGVAGDEGQDTRKEARAALALIGEPALPALCDALTDANGFRRLSAALTLGDIASRSTVKPLVAAIYAGTPQDSAPAWWERSYLNACAASLGRITGKTFGYDAGKLLARKSAEEILNWWAENCKDFPPQIGDEPPVPDADGELPEPPDQLKEIRSLPARRYARPESREEER